MIKNVKTRLVYYFYASNENFLNEESNRIHFECWKRYFKQFDEIIFVISTNPNIDYGETIISLKKFILANIATRVIRFEHIVNNPYIRETTTFINEISKKLNNLDGVTFFGHNKGISSCHNPQEVLNTYQWIIGLYYLTFNFMDEVFDGIYNQRYLSYGAFFTDCSADAYNEIANKGWWGKNRWMYSGTFFAIDAQLLGRYIKNCNVNLEEINSGLNRWTVENFLSEIYPKELAYSHNYQEINCNFYSTIEQFLPMIMTDKEYSEFKKMSDTILANINALDWSLS